LLLVGWKIIAFVVDNVFGIGLRRVEDDKDSLTAQVVHARIVEVEGVVGTDGWRLLEVAIARSVLPHQHLGHKHRVLTSSVRTS
jgi:hypothetical protein